MAKRHNVQPQRLELHNAFVKALGSNVTSISDITYRPFLVTLSNPLPLTIEVYLFPALNPMGGRSAHEYKINLLLQDHKPREKRNFPTNDHFLILVSYVQDFKIFVLFDPYSHKEFTPNTNVQFPDSLVFQAMLNGIAWFRKKSGEVLIASTSRRLIEALNFKFLGKTPTDEFHTRD